MTELDANPSSNRSKLAVAVFFLDQAIRYYYEGDWRAYCASLHLAGTAQELLAGFVERLGGSTSVANMKTIGVQIANSLFSDDGSDEIISAAHMHQVMFSARNRVKHMNAAGDDEIKFDPQSEAKDCLNLAMTDFYWLLARMPLVETAWIARFNAEG